jgi:hypothetical protein
MMAGHDVLQIPSFSLSPAEERDLGVLTAIRLASLTIVISGESGPVVEGKVALRDAKGSLAQVESLSGGHARLSAPPGRYYVLAWTPDAAIGQAVLVDLSPAASIQQTINLVRGEKRTFRLLGEARCFRTTLKIEWFDSTTNAVLATDELQPTGPEVSIHRSFLAGSYRVNVTGPFVTGGIAFSVAEGGSSDTLDVPVRLLTPEERGARRR